MEIKNTSEMTRAFVKIEDGCNNFCTYCVIPFTRGGVRSKNHNKVIEEVTNLVNNGYKEIVLTGIHTGAYNDGVFDFAMLLNSLVNIEGLLRLRISSIEINELNDRVLEVFKHSKVLVPHFHVPLQSGSERILKEMNRKYDKAFFEKKINQIREINPDTNFTTDVIVGFPSETEEEHLESLEFIKHIGFSKVHAFPYSDREGTVASKMKDKISPEVKKRRNNELIKLSNLLNMEYNNKFVGREMEVLFEEYKDGYFLGHTVNFIKVKDNKEHSSNEVSSITLTTDNMLNS